MFPTTRWRTCCGSSPMNPRDPDAGGDARRGGFRHRRRPLPRRRQECRDAAVERARQLPQRARLAVDRLPHPGAYRHQHARRPGRVERGAGAGGAGVAAVPRCARHPAHDRRYARHRRARRGPCRRAGLRHAAAGRVPVDAVADRHRAAGGAGAGTREWRNGDPPRARSSGRGAATSRPGGHGQARSDAPAGLAAPGRSGDRDARPSRLRPVRGRRPADSFYTWGSMGMASSIGLGVALARPERGVVVCDGDGSC